MFKCPIYKYGLYNRRVPCLCKNQKTSFSFWKIKKKLRFKSKKPRNIPGRINQRSLHWFYGTCVTRFLEKQGREKNFANKMQILAFGLSSSKRIVSICLFSNVFFVLLINCCFLCVDIQCPFYNVLHHIYLSFGGTVLTPFETKVT